MARGTTWFRYALTLALLAAGAQEAWATRLDKTACADLNTELSSLLALGLKEDMDKGPAWAAANLPPERLVSINKVIELQGQIEFRCGPLPGRNVAKSPNAKPGDKKPADKPETAKAATAKSNTEESGDDATPATKPAQKAKTMRHKRGSAATSPELPPVVPVATTPAPEPPRATAPAAPSSAVTPAKPAPEVNRTAAIAPPVASPPAGNKITPASTTTQAPAPAAPVTAPPSLANQVGAPVPGSQKAAAQKAAAKKPSRRDSTNAYMSPSEVNAFGLPTGN